jgi:hypothetical protein
MSAQHRCAHTNQHLLAPCLALSQATIAGGGVIPHIHKSLINKQVGKKDV